MKRITEYISRCSMLAQGKNVLCAVSGGADSMCLLHVLKSLEKQLGLRVAAAHFEHGIRGEESLRDLRFVEKYCGELDIPFLAERGNVPARAAELGLGIEETARLLRYDFLERARRSLGCDVIATAHHMDDNAETVLFHLIRGSGSAGLAGIPPVRGRIIRPLLCLSREDIERYLEENGVPHVEDSTNLSAEYARNRIRSLVMPELKKLSPSAPEAIFRASELLRADDVCLTAQAAEFVKKNSRTEKNGAVSVPSAALAALPFPVASRAVRLLFSGSLSREQTESVLRLCRTTERVMADLPGGRVTAEQGRLFFPPPGGAAAAGKQDGTPLFAPVELRPGTRTEIPGAGVAVTCEKCVFREDVHGLFNTLVLNYGEINGRLVCTPRQPGDRLRPAGRGCTKTLKSLFMEARLPASVRDRTLVFRDDAGILSVAGLALAERAAAREGEEALQLTVTEL